jgi:REP element-mobilizing transposase RayT
MSGVTMKRNANGFEYPEYDKTQDYKALVYNHRSTGCWSSYKNSANDFEVMFRSLDNLYKTYPDPNYQWYCCAISDRMTEWKKRKSQDFFHIPKTKVADEQIWLFVTINLNDSKLLETQYSDAMRSIVESVLSSNDKAFTNYQMRMVCEKYREAGIHHHIHLLLVGKEKQAPSYIVQRLFRLSAIKQVVDKPNFIDVKTSWAKKYEHKCAPLATCINYIEGNKGTQSKIANVEKDKNWRKENALKDEYNNF